MSGFVVVNDAVPIVFRQFGCIWFISVLGWVGVVIKSGFKGCFTASYIFHDFALVSFLFPRSSSVGSISCSLWRAAVLLHCFAGCFMEMSVAVEGGGGSYGVTVAVYTIDFALHRPFIGQLDVSRQLHGFSSVATLCSKILSLWFDIMLFMFWHAAVAYFEGVSVANFSELVTGIAEMFVNQLQELFADVCAYVLAKRWLNHTAFLDLPFFGLRCCWVGL